MADKNTDFLKFNAYQIKDLITQKLASDSRFTDQIYEGSNISLLINLVSYMYQCLMYNLNNAASESMFSDTQIYENINRLVNLIGYNPKGCSPASFNVQIISTESEQRGGIIPIYSKLDTGMTDRNGRKIYFSTSETCEFDTNDTNQGRTIAVYNGEWKLYNNIFTASGEEDETFVLNALKSSTEDDQNIAYDFIHVYVKNTNGQITRWKNDPNGIFLNYTNDTQIFGTNNSIIYDNEKKVYSTSLDQDKTYQIRFGNGIVGQKLNKGDLVYVFYLDTNGYDGNIDISDIDFNSVKFQQQDFGLSNNSDLYIELFGQDLSGKLLKDYQVFNILNTMSQFKPEESVEDIRKNAPNWLKTGNRLVTKSDYEYFIKNTIYVKELISSLRVVDAKVMNNMEYVASFYKWLYLKGKKFHNDGRYYFNQTSFWNRHGYPFVDPADANNTYIWLKSDEYDRNGDQYDLIQMERDLNLKLEPLKTMTTEIKVVKPVIVDFDICANTDTDYVKNNYLIDNEYGVFDPSCESYIEVTMDDRTIFVGTQVQRQIYEIITDTFNINNCVLGQNIDVNQILNKIYSIPGIKNIRTIYTQNGTTDYRIINGLSFASWSPLLSDGYDDLYIGNSSIKLEEFQFPMFVGRDKLIERIKVITEQLTPISIVKQ